jgi:uroporphyrinogen-III decarboxylase
VGYKRHVVTSRERILAAFRRGEVDHLPCSIYFNDNMRAHGYDPGTPESIVSFHEALGVDPVLDIPAVRARFHPSVRTRVWVGRPPGAEADVLYKEYDTPAGALRVGVRLTPEWPFGRDIPFPGDDFCASHLVEPLVKGPDDVDAFAFLLRPPERADLDRLMPRIQSVKSVAAAHDVAVRVTAGQGLATLMFQMGAEHLVLFAVDHPEAFARLARIESDATVAALPLYAEVGVDIVKRFGGYEQTNFFGPALWRGVVGPALGREVEAAHACGLPIYYRVVTGMKPLLDDIGAAGLDCVEGFEPVLSDCPNREIRQRLGGKVCLWTGVSSPGHLGSPDPEVVRAAVREAVETFGRQGFILGVTNSIRAHWKWENTLAMVEEWKRVR